MGGMMLHVSRVSWETETELWQAGYARIAGVDEAGRGALAGPVVAAAVVFPPGTAIPKIDDSKRLTCDLREALFQQIANAASGISVGYSDAEVIDDINIRQGTLLAMQAAVRGLPCLAEFLLIDGRDGVPSVLPQRMVVRGDQTVGSIAAASIVAKVTRDHLMERLDRQFPGYGFAQHKGYGTTAHLRALQLLGPSLIHRKTFRGVTCKAGGRE
jgi:ribonuclease HII